MTLREPQCVACGCPRSAHHKEHESVGDVNQTREPRWFACLNVHCPCWRYMPPPE